MPKMAGGGTHGSGLVTGWGSLTVGLDGLEDLFHPSPSCDKLLIIL